MTAIPYDTNTTAPPTFNIFMKAGPLRNGAERGHGSIWHAVNGDAWSGVAAICGDQPRIQWSSWTPAGQQVTCKKCLRLIAKGAAR
jgi:hypothetical protein